MARIVGAPTLYNDRLYVAVASTEDSAAANPSYSCCTFRGSVVALDIASGRTLWKSYTVLEEPQPTRKSSGGIQEFGPAGAAISSSPTIDAKTQCAVRRDRRFCDQRRAIPDGRRRCLRFGGRQAALGQAIGPAGSGNGPGRLLEFPRFTDTGDRQ